MNLASANDLLDTYARATERLDVDSVMELYRADAELRDDPFEPALVGDLEIRRHWNRRAAARTNIELDIERSWLSGSTVLMAWHGAHTRRSTAERVRSRGFATFELDDAGLIARERRWTLQRVVGIDGSVEPDAEAPADAGPLQPEGTVPTDDAQPSHGQERPGSSASAW